ncbi:uncharacterized protein [Rutidosis leptorrhynchoides]|uniref:uncharacterized protein n=1 Tax=Rutidosis leptorrhynchoides TaxID=125765 RepID=UPI003A98D7BD
MGERLKTQDKLKCWECRPGEVLLCPLCSQVPDSHDHLFFACSFSASVWSMATKHVDFPIIANGWKDIYLLLSPFATRKLAKITIIKLIYGASVYIIWQERNKGLFKKGRRSAKQVYEVIYLTVRMKLMSLKWKMSASVLRLKSDWKIS